MVWSREHRSLTIGLIVTVTMIAFEALGVATAMPETARDLDGIALYGWAFSATFLASLVGIGVAGPQVDRRGPAAPFAAGLVLFATGLAVAGAAPSMWVVVMGRALQGLGSGVLPPVAYAAIGRAYDERGRARMFALLSSAWVVPGLVGPGLAGLVASTLTWRLVFAGILPVVAVPALMALPALRRLGPPASAPAAPPPGRTLDAVRLAVGTGLLVGGLGSGSLWIGALLVVGGLMTGAPAGRRLLPPGTATLRAGLPATVAARGYQTFTFFTAQAFLPLGLTVVRGRTTVFAGLALTAATLTWTMGAWIQAQAGHRVGRHRMVAGGLTVVVTGTAAVVVTLVIDAVPIAVPVVAWAIAGLGMGASYSGISLLVLAAAPSGSEGTASASMQLADVLGVALGTGLGGVAVAVGERAGWSSSIGIAVAYGLAVAAGVTAVVAAVRIGSAADGAGSQPGGQRNGSDETDGTHERPDDLDGDDLAVGDGRE